MSNLKRTLTVLALLAVIAAPILVFLNAQSLSDWWKLRGYTPPAEITALATDDTMTAYTQHLFYINHPQIVSGVSSFRQDCPVAEQTIVLGCYHPDQDGIFIYSVNDPTLYGIEQVTAAHEVLHAVYARLTGSARNQLDSELQSYYDSGLTDQRVISEIKLYQQTEPDSVMDEMSCTFGTEIANLPPALESYYKPFFSNRPAVVGYEQRYQGEFTSRENQISADDAQLSNLKAAIDSQEENLQTELNQINANRAKLDSLRNSGQYQQYNSEVGTFNTEVSAYNTGVDRLRSEINSYNSLVAARNAIAVDLNGLDQAIDTRLVPQSAQ